MYICTSGYHWLCRSGTLFATRGRDRLPPWRAPGSQTCTVPAVYMIKRSSGFRGGAGDRSQSSLEGPGGGPGVPSGSLRDLRRVPQGHSARAERALDPSIHIYICIYIYMIIQTMSYVLTLMSYLQVFVCGMCERCMATTMMHSLILRSPAPRMPWPRC